MVQHTDGTSDEATEGQPPWTLPGGAVDPASHDRVGALKQSLAEGFGLDIAGSRFVRRYLHGPRLHYVYCVRPSTARITINPDTFAGAAWLTQAKYANGWRAASSPASSSTPS
jgi:hypothetical protein